ncbi:MAG TPA: hypothetical protein VM598_14590, partial [Bdellovibrionota bacterium]|nr:hypothetical protein [Bdellovibrionota bacterium]
NHVRKTVGLQDVLIAFTADHGVQPHPAQARMWRFDSGTIDDDQLSKDVNAALDEKFGKPSGGVEWIALANDLNYWLSPAALADRKAARADVEAAAKQIMLKVPGVGHVFTSTEYAARRLPPGIVERQILNSYFPGRSGELVIIPRPYYTQHDKWYEVTHTTGHNYDRRVPIILSGAGVKPGRYAQSAEVIDIAPTLSFLLGVLPPSMSHGRVLSEIVK